MPAGTEKAKFGKAFKRHQCCIFWRLFCHGDFFP